MALTYGSELQKKTAAESFWNAAFAVPTPYDGLFFSKPSTQKTETYTHLGAAPMPQEWVGDREFKKVPEQNFDLTNIPFDSSVRVDKELVKYQQWDEIGKLIGNLGTKAMAHKHKKLSALADVGDATVCIDGQFFFDDDHTDPGAAYQTANDNDLTAAAATGTQPTDLEMAAAIRSCFDAMVGFKDDQGDPIGYDFNPANWIVMVPPAYRSVALQVQNNNQLTGPIGNDLQGTFTVRLDQFATSVSEFHFYYIGGQHKPYILQETGGIEFTDSIDRTSGDYLYSASWWGQTGYGEYRTGILFTFS